MGVSRSLLALALAAALTTSSCSSVDAFRNLRRSRTENPVPAGYTKPLIDTSGGAPDKDAQLATLASILTKEPPSAFSSSSSSSDDDPNNPLYDNDVDQPQDEDSKREKAKAAYAKEVKQLKNLIHQGTAIVKLLPEKQKRLSELEAKLKTLQGASTANQADAQLEKQQELLKAVQNKSTELTEKLKALKDTQAKLEASIQKVQTSSSSSSSSNVKFRSVRNEDDSELVDEEEGRGEENEREEGENENENEVENDGELVELSSSHGKDLAEALKE